MNTHGENRKGRKHPGLRTAVLLVLTLILLLCGCAKKEQVPAPEEGKFQVWYLDHSAIMLESLPYDANARFQEELIPELMAQFLTVPNDADLVSAAGEKVEYEGFTMEGPLLYLYFDEYLGEMKPERKILCCAALTKTMAQVPGVERVAIYTAGQPLQASDGTMLGPFAASDFVTGVSNVNSYETTELALYFAAEDGNRLSKEERTVTYRMDTPLEQLVVEQLIEGPKWPGRQAVISPDTRLLSISVTDTICYLNFSREFLNPVPVEDPWLTIHALVNSLSDLKTVTRVQIAVEGSQDVLFRDTIPLNTLFEPDFDYGEETQ